MGSKDVGPGPRCTCGAYETATVALTLHPSAFVIFFDIAAVSPGEKTLATARSTVRL